MTQNITSFLKRFVKNKFVKFLVNDPYSFLYLGVIILIKDLTHFSKNGTVWCVHPM